MNSMENKLKYRYYILTYIHLIIIAIIVMGILINVLFWKSIGSILRGFGIYTLLNYWIAILYFSKQREPYNLLSETMKSMVKPEKVIIRPARPTDAPVGARLMYYAGANYMLAFFGSTERKAITVIRRMFSLPGHMTSYTYVFVAEYGCDVVALFSGLDGKSWRASKRASWIYGPVWWIAAPLWQTPKMISAFNEFDKAIPPVLDDEYYVEHLAVLPENRGQGIAEQLMDFAESLAKTKGLKRIVLDVEIENEGARRFYKRLGFIEAKFVTDKNYCKRFSFRGSIRMVKSIATQQKNTNV